jgi:transposase-like protein
MTKKSGHTRTASEDTVQLVRRLAVNYEHRTIAAILAKNSTAAPPPGCPSPEPGWPPCANYNIPDHQPTAADVRPADDDTVVVTISDAAKILGVGKATLYRWLREGSSSVSRSPPAHPGGFASIKRCGTGSNSRCPTAVWRSTEAADTRGGPTNGAAQSPTRRTTNRLCQSWPQRTSYPGQPEHAGLSTQPMKGTRSANHDWVGPETPRCLWPPRSRGCPGDNAAKLEAWAGARVRNTNGVFGVGG